MDERDRNKSGVAPALLSQSTAAVRCPILLRAIATARPIRELSAGAEGEAARLVKDAWRARLHHRDCLGFDVLTGRRKNTPQSSHEGAVTWADL